jgi:predicted Zn-dependent peptidase
VLTLVLAAQIAAVALPAARFELPNGLRVWVRQDRTRPIALVQVTYKVGSLHESAGLTGIAHYVEHMVYRATENVRNEDSYGYIDRIGGRYTGGTWPEVTKYSELVPNWALESALLITAERMTRALFDSLEFERERSNVITEANGYADQDPLSAFQDAVLQASFEVHPYRNNSNTWARDNLVLTRADAFAWYKRYYGPNNAVLAIVGDVDPDSVRALVVKHFAGLTRAPETGEIRIVEPPQRTEKRVELQASGVTKRLEILYRAPNAAHADHPVLVVLNRVLRARLTAAFQRVGHDSAFSSADSATQYPYVLRLSIPSRADENLDGLLAIVQAEIDSLASQGATAIELTQARVRPPRPAGERGRAAAGPPRRNFLSALADSLTDLEPEAWEVSAALRARIDAGAQRVTAQDISAFARRWLRRSQRTVGMLLPGKDDFEPRWTDGRPLAGDRMEIPPLTTAPAARQRPEAVPARALRPLAAIQVPHARQVLENGVIVRVGSTHPERGGAAVHARVSFTSSADSAAAAQLLARDTRLRRLGVTTSWHQADTGRASGPLAVAVVASPRIASLEALGEEASRVFARLPRRQRHTTSTPHAPGEQRIRRPGEPQVEIVMTLPAVPRGHPDRQALELLNYIVGVPWYGGRLGWALTKTGLTYSSSATTRFGVADGAIRLETTSDTRNVDAVIQSIREVVEGVGERGIEEWELQEAKAFTLGRHVLYGAREDSDAATIAVALTDSEHMGLELLDLPAFSRAYLAVGLDDVNRVARRYYRVELLKVVARGAVQPRRETNFPPGTFRRLFDP